MAAQLFMGFFMDGDKPISSANSEAHPLSQLCDQHYAHACISACLDLTNNHLKKNVHGGLKGNIFREQTSLQNSCRRSAILLHLHPISAAEEGDATREEIAPLAERVPCHNL